MKYHVLKTYLIAFSAILTSCSGLKSTETSSSPIRYGSYKSLVMAGYQGWFNAEGDGGDRGFYHYEGRNGFKPGSASVDMWPDVSEYQRTYPTDFKMADGSQAHVFSSEDSTTVDIHFRWMRDYGLDGVFMQRFLTEIKHPSGKRHFNKVLGHAMTAALQYERAIAVMYDLSGVSGRDCRLIPADIDSIARCHSLFDRNLNPSYLYHNGRPLVAVWGVGFNDGRAYGLDDVELIIRELKQKGFSIMLGVPTNWRTLNGDTEPNPKFHAIIKSCDIIMPWFVGRYDETGYEDFKFLIADDIKWCKAAGIDYVPLVYPGFSWKNMCGHDSFNVPRNNGSFFTRQLEGALDAGAEMLYIAMFDEIDEGTAIFKCAKQVPISENGTEFIPIDGDITNDFYLKAAGEISRRLKTKDIH